MDIEETDEIELRSTVQTEGDLFEYQVTTVAYGKDVDLITEIRITNVENALSQKVMHIPTSEIDSLVEALRAHLESIKKHEE